MLLGASFPGAVSQENDAISHCHGYYILGRRQPLPPWRDTESTKRIRAGRGKHPLHTPPPGSPASATTFESEETAVGLRLPPLGGMSAALSLNKTPDPFFPRGVRVHRASPTRGGAVRAGSLRERGWGSAAGRVGLGGEGSCAQPLVLLTASGSELLGQ